MFFNSIEFGLFFPLVFLLYWLIFTKNITLRNSFLIVVSYFFYGIWDWRFLALIFISSLTDYLIGRKLGIETNHKKRKLYLGISIFLNIGLLGFFKYFNFFTDSFVEIFTLFGQEFSASRLNIILPVGISFYTFQTLSFTIDVYRKELEPTKDALSFFAFVSFFPQLVAGPIERAKKLLPQFYVKHDSSYRLMRAGFLMIAVGLFKKIMIADRLAIYVDATYSDITGATGLPMTIGVLFFMFQLYLDFSAYSDIAIGAAKTFGFELSTNFRRPFLANSFSSFWTRWHISLSSWFRDYLYIPLGGSRAGNIKKVRNVLIVFIVSGLWHGASWNFVVWGALNGFFLILFDKYLTKSRNYRLPKALFVVICWMFSLVFFRATNFSDAFDVFNALGFANSESVFDFGLNSFEFKLSMWLLVGVIMVELLAEKNFVLSDWILERNFLIRYSYYLIITVAIILFGSYGLGLNDQQFIYFQF